MCYSLEHGWRDNQIENKSGFDMFNNKFKFTGGQTAGRNLTFGYD